PSKELAVDDQERFDRAAALYGLDRTVFGNERGRAAAVDTHDGPIRLLDETARIAAARRAFGECREERVRRGTERERLDGDVREAIPIVLPRVQRQPHIPRFGLGQPQRVAAAVAVEHAPNGPPLSAIVGELDAVACGGATRLPFEREAAEFARNAEVDVVVLLGTERGVAAPGRGARFR